MVDHEDPNTWTTRYVISHRKECLTLIREVNQTTIRCVREGNYAAAIAGLDRILNGLITMHNSKRGNYHSLMSMFSMVNAIIIMTLKPSLPPSNASKATSIAIGNLEDARDFATKAKTKQNVEALIGQIKAGYDVGSQDINDAIKILEQLDHQIALIM